MSPIENRLNPESGNFSSSRQLSILWFLDFLFQLGRTGAGFFRSKESIQFSHHYIFVVLVEEKLFTRRSHLIVVDLPSLLHKPARLLAPISFFRFF